ncbi:hypothetical protein BD311DRAFT_661646 [Dichomitus squalens]|uniref:Uncharacterized protein n=1 Tax=Dichomitus squalens TaxID=114155 RepID=A0A4Q9MQ30_9APHY|nr:hypothetical protein BD311DRAFT_661646 [Dichomitus squalens]
MYDQINNDGNGLKGPKDVTGVLSKLQYLMRLCFLKEAHVRMNAASSQDLELAEHVKAQKQWFSAVVDSPFTSIEEYQQRASRLVFSMPGIRHFIWKADATLPTLVLPDGELSLQALSGCLTAIQGRARTLLTERLLFGHPFFIDLESLKNDWTNETAGYSLFSDLRNQACFGPSDALARHIYGTSALRNRFIASSGQAKLL